MITFDSRGIANTTNGTKPYSIQQLANDTAGLLDALKIPKADILGYSLGSYIAQQFAVSHPEKVNNLVQAKVVELLTEWKRKAELSGTI